MPSVTWKRAGLVVFAVIAAGAVGIGFLAGRGDHTPQRTRSTAPRSAGTQSAAGDLVEVRQDQAGFAISYPKAWIRSQSSDPQVTLIAAENDPAQNRGGSILVRVTGLQAPVGREQLGDVRKATDAIVRSGEGVELKAEPAEITEGGLPGFYYLYTFKDPVSGQRGAHSHYFLFKGATMVSLVFQALPDAEFSRLAPLFDRVVQSFRVL